jgi:small-conductance mechanosensitive channel
MLNAARHPLATAAGGAAPPAEAIAESASSLWESALDALPRVGAAVAIVALGWVAGRLVRHAGARVLRRRRTPSFATVMSTLASWLFVMVVVLVAVAITFPSVRPVDILAGLGFFSLAVGFAFQDILENLLSGVLLCSASRSVPAMRSGCASTSAPCGRSTSARPSWSRSTVSS